MDDIVTDKNGIKYRLLSRHDLIGRLLKLHGEFEPETQQITKHVIAGKQGRVLDVGANMGTYCIPLARAYPHIEFVAFEVQQEIFAQLKENISINGVYNINAIHSGLSDKTEQIAASIPKYELETNIGGFSLDDEVRRNDYEVSTVGGIETFSLVPLDTFNLRDVLLIKIDVESMELKVLAGAITTLKENGFPPILFETWSWKPWFQNRREEIFKFLRDLGYQITQFGNNNIAQHISRNDALEFSINHQKSTPASTQPPTKSILEPTPVHGRNFRMFPPLQDRGNYENFPYKPFTADLLARLLVAADVFVDVGAHCGYFSLLAASLRPTLKILSIEPEPSACALLRRGVALLDAPNIEVHQLAASNATGRTKFVVAGATEESHCHFHGAAPAATLLDVETGTVDSLLADLTPGSLVIKISAQGGELAVLEGLSETLNRGADLKLLIDFNPRAQMAAGHRPEALLGRLDELGYVVHLLDEQGRQFSRIRANTNWHSLLTSGLANLYCVRRERALSVCFFSHASGLSGAEQVLLELVDDLVADHGAVCTVVLPAQGPLVPSLKRAGAACVVGFPYAWWCSNSDQVFSDAVQQRLIVDNVNALGTALLPSLRQLDPDVIWTQTMVIPWGAVVAAKLGKPHVWSVNEFGEKDFGFNFFAPFPSVCKDILDSADVIFACSKTVAQTLFPAASPSQVRVLYCHVDIPAEKLRQDQASLFRSPQAIRLGIFGQVRPTKGQAEVIRATARLLSQGHQVELLVAGGGLPAYMDEIAALIHSLGIEQHVHLAGFLANPYPAMQQCDILLVSSQMEAFGRSGVEAMLLGKPVVFAAAGGLSEFMLDGETGLSYAPGDVDRLVLQLEQLLADPDQRRTLGEKGRAHALALFSKEQFSGEAWRALRRLQERGKKASAMPDQMPSIIEKAMKAAAVRPVPRQTAKAGRNDPCPCGSGKKYKHCHGRLS